MFKKPVKYKDENGKIEGIIDSVYMIDANKVSVVLSAHISIRDLITCFGIC